MQEHHAIETKDLYFSYGDTLILENVDIFIKDKEFIGIFGPNGGGKTTLLKILLGLLTPSSGLVKLYGKPPKDLRPSIGYVPQINLLDRKFPITCEELVNMGILKGATASAADALEKVGLLPYRHLPFGALSGGMAQRALIARAIAGNPKILVLDEPTASVDPKAEEDILSLLLTLKKDMTIIMVTHDLHTILHSVEKWLCVHRHVHTLASNAVCQHFGLGLYHTPMASTPTTPLRQIP